MAQKLLVRTMVVVAIVVVVVVPGTWGHGRLMDPPARNSMWRLGFNNPVNYNDNELYCGGRMVQWLRNGGKCGVCGDAYHGDREHEAGGKYANGIITRTYHQGDVMPVTVHLTANHQGWFELRICPVNDPKKRVTQECLDKHVLQRADGGGMQFPVPKGKYNAFFNYTVQLPPDLTCKQCVVQWKYRTGNTWDKDDNSGVFCLGCGPQEEFYNCADIEILPGSRADNQPPPELNMVQEATTEATNTIGSDDKTNSKKDSHAVKKDDDWHVQKTDENSVQKTSEKSLWDKKRDLEVKGHLGNNVVDKPKEDKYSWHAASPISWAVLGSRLAAPGRPATTTTAAPRPSADTTTPRRSIFTPHPTATKRQSRFTSHLVVPLYMQTTRTTPAPTTTTPASPAHSQINKESQNKKNKESQKQTSGHKLSPFHPPTTATTASSQSTIWPPNAKSTTSRHSRRRVMPSWLIRVAQRIKQNKTPTTENTKVPIPRDDDIQTRRELFRQQLWRHLRRNNQRRQQEANRIDRHKSDEQQASTASEPETTKVTPTCLTTSRRDNPQEKPVSQVYQQENPRPEVYQQETPRAAVYQQENPRTQVYHQLQHQPLGVRPHLSRPQPTSQWWHGGYSNLLWTPRATSPQALVGGQLRCRATVSLGGGMDEWCTANCNANYCPASMCVCQHEQDAFAPAYEVYHAHSPAAWLNPYRHRRVPTTYSGLSHIRVPVPESSQRSEVPSESIFSPPADYNYVHKKPQTKEFVATYPPFLKEESSKTKHVAEGGDRVVGRGYVLTRQWERKQVVCRAVGRYAGLTEYDEWCSNNCAQAMCPLLMCQCDSF